MRPGWRRSAQRCSGSSTASSYTRGVPERTHVELIGKRWIEPIVSPKAVEGYDEKLRPVLARKPLEQAANNSQAAFDL